MRQAKCGCRYDSHLGMVTYYCANVETCTSKQEWGSLVKKATQLAQGMAY